MGISDIHRTTGGDGEIDLNPVQEVSGWQNYQLPGVIKSEISSGPVRSQWHIRDFLYI